MTRPAILYVNTTLEALSIANGNVLARSQQHCAMKTDSLAPLYPLPTPWQCGNNIVWHLRKVVGTTFMIAASDYWSVSAAIYAEGTSINLQHYYVLNNFLVMRFLPSHYAHRHSAPCFLWCLSIHTDQSEKGPEHSCITGGKQAYLQTKWMHRQVIYFNELFSTITFHLLSISHSIKRGYDLLSCRTHDSPFQVNWLENSEVLAETRHKANKRSRAKHGDVLIFSLRYLCQGLISLPVMTADCTCRGKAVC